MIGALVVMPFAFAAAGVVLGDVGPVEALRRSMALFRARPRITLVRHSVHARHLGDPELRGQWPGRMPRCA